MTLKTLEGECSLIPESKIHTVEILLATYNGDKFLDDQIESITAQSYVDWKITVRDDGSSDNTLHKLSYWSDFLGDKFNVVNDCFNSLGPSKNFSKLLELSSSRYVMLCDQDDIWMPEKLRKSLDLLHKAELKHGYDFPLMVCSDLEIVDHNLNTLTPSFWKDRKDDPDILNDYEKLIAHSVVTGNTILLNRSAVDLVVPINTNFFLHDQWISILVAYHGQIYFLDEPLVKYRQHGKNVLGSFQTNTMYLIKKIRFLPSYINSWFKLKQELNIDFSVTKVLIFKSVYNFRKFYK